MVSPATSSRHDATNPAPSPSPTQQQQQQPPRSVVSTVLNYVLRFAVYPLPATLLVAVIFQNYPLLLTPMPVYFLHRHATLPLFHIIMTVTLVAFAVPAFSLLWLNHVREQVLTAQLRATGERLRQVETDRERLQWVVAEVLNMTGKVSVQVPLDRCIRSQVLDERIRWTEGDDGRGVVGAILGAATAQLGGRASDESITSTNMVGTLATGLSVVGSSVPVAARVASVVGGERIRETRRPVNAAETVAVATAPVTVAKSPKAAARRSDAAGVRREEIVAGVAMPDSPQDGISPIAVAAAESEQYSADSQETKGSVGARSLRSRVRATS